MSRNLEVKYIQSFLNSEDSASFMSELSTYDFQRYPIKVNGKDFLPTRKVCAFSDDGVQPYTFNGLTVPASPWTPHLLHLKSLVESACGSTFNYALLNYYANGRDKIGAHKDTEIGLDPDSPIAAVSLGATRTMLFTRKNFKTEQLPLENGSLLIMSAGSNKLWSHGIPPEPKITEPRISITFRRMKSAENMSGPPPAKRPRMDPTPVENCPIDPSLEDGLDGFFISLDPSLLEGKTKEASETILRNELGKNIFLSCELFKGYVKVHIREYGVNDTGTLYPTKNGVVMDLPTWYEFSLKLFNFNLHYSHASYVANNSVIVLSMQNCMHIQLLNAKTHALQLDDDQRSVLKDSVHELNESIIQYLFTQRLPHFIECERRLLAILSPEEEDDLMVKLVLSIENELCKIFQSVYECYGCIIDHPSQTQHDCITYSNLEKFQLLGDRVFLFLNMQTIAKQFVSSVDFISENFMKHISVNMIRDLLFKKHY